MKIIGITGMLGAGKGAVVDYLQTKGFNHHSVRGYLTTILKEQHKEATRGNLVTLANELRTAYSGDYLFQELLRKAQVANQDAIIESIRTLDEVDTLEKVGTLFAVNADKIIRYSRIPNRGTETDNVTFEQFQADELLESENPDPKKQNLILCIQRAKPEFQFTNNGTLVELHAQIDRALLKI